MIHHCGTGPINNTDIVILEVMHIRSFQEQEWEVDMQVKHTKVWIHKKLAAFHNVTDSVVFESVNRADDKDPYPYFSLLGKSIDLK